MKSGCFRIPKRVRDGVQLLAEDALIVIGGSLAAVGIVELSGWSSKELIKEYTPLLLAMFSIIVTVSALRLNIREGRDRARQERDQAVRPVLALTLADQLAPERDRVDFELGYPKPVDKEVIYDEKWLEIENIGVGPALDMQIVAFVNFEYCKVGGNVDVLKVGNKKFIRLCLRIPKDSIESLYTVFCDVYGNPHVCSHNLIEHEVDDSEYIMNHYLRDDYPYKKQLIDIWGNLNPCSFKFVKQGIAESESVRF